MAPKTPKKPFDLSGLKAWPHQRTPRIDPMPKKLGDFLSPEVISSVEAAVEAFNPGFSEKAKEREKELEFDNKEDLSKESREALALYTAENQKAVNTYHSDEITTRTSPGYRRGDVIPQVQDENAFAPSPQPYFDDLSGGTSANATLGSFFGQDRLDKIIVKDGLWSPPSEGLGPFNGNVVNQVKFDDQGYLIPNNLTEGIEEVLDETNRYSPKEDSSPFLKDPTSTNEMVAIPKGLWSVQTGKGVYGKYDPDATGVTVEHLQKMAISLMVNASGHDGLVPHDLGPPEGFWDLLKWSVVADFAALVPSAIQVGAKKMSINDLRIKNTSIAKNLPRTNGSGTDDHLFSSKAANDIMLVQAGGGFPDGPNKFTAGPANAGSYGNLNSFLEPFDGPFPIGMSMLALIGLLGTIAAGSLLMGMISDDNAGNDPANSSKGDPDAPWTLALGSAYPKGGGIKEMFMQLYGFPRLTEDVGMTNCLVRGLMMFFGIPFDPREDGIDLEDVMETAVNIVMAPGYYVVVIKQVIRDMEQIHKAVSGFGSVMGVTGAITQVFKLIEALFSSTTFRFIMIMAEMGNIHAKETQNLTALLVGQGKGSEGSLNVLTPLNRMVRGRVYTKHGGSLVNVESALSLKRFHALLLGAPNASKFGAVSMVGEEKLDQYEHQGKFDQRTRPWLINAKRGNRISQEIVEAYESYVNLEYVPFTIQDLRTNEIISLPAFITNISDDFSADYSNTQGYGRTDPVWIYSKTTRSIQISFVLVAMNEGDFEYMWFVINRLVAMLYPQRSQGRIRTFNAKTKKFVQPFSQTPTASPVIRLRLGELFHTNYTVKRLANLFGDNGVLNLKVDPTESAEAIESHRIKVVNAARPNFKVGIEEDLKNSFIKGEAVAPTKVWVGAGTKVSVLPYGDQLFPSKKEKQDKLPKNPTDFSINCPLQFEVMELLAVAPPVPAAATPKANPPVTTYKGYLLDPEYSDNLVSAFGKGRKNNLKAILNHVAPDAMDITVILQIPSAREVTPLEADVEAKLETLLEDTYKPADFKKLVQGSTEVDEFFTPEKNAIVRSFGSAAGRGLAGVITQMGLDYGSGQWGVDVLKKDRAPKRVDINMTFAPIHDLPLGLDDMGRIMAPSHPVGGLNRDPRGSYKETEQEETRKAQGRWVKQKKPEADVAKADSDADAADEPKPG